MKTTKTIPPEVAAVIPCGQLEVTKQNPDAYAEPVKWLEEQLKKCLNFNSEYEIQHRASNQGENPVKL
jgi:hypothetical protein